jgi:acylphosphatase
MVITRTRAHVYYTGRVQGVGFRYTARSVACGFEVTGFVRNLADRRVELVVEGERTELDGYLDAIRTGAMEHYIRNENVVWEPATGEFAGFEIRF